MHIFIYIYLYIYIYIYAYIQYMYILIISEQHNYIGAVAHTEIKMAMNTNSTLSKSID